ncbi:MAG: RnfABCDGE type electron transport complex subunit D [Oscillospiraceae bacterium]|nr:RnfABCDGE type electron transport complex subunit D [Oscillospiraceae bacterium]
MAQYHFGERALRMAAFSVLFTVMLETALCFMPYFRRSFSISSSLFTALSVSLLMPAAAPYWLPVCGIFPVYLFSAYLKAKKFKFLPPGGAVLPEGAAAVFLITLFFNRLAFAYPVNKSRSLAYMLQSSMNAELSEIRFADIYSGNLPGPMGATCLAVLAGGLVYLIARVIRRPKTGTAAAPVSYILGAALTALIFQRTNLGRQYSVLFELSSGMLLFAAVVFISDRRLYPDSRPFRIGLAFGGGISAVLLRHIGFLEDWSCFTVILIAAVTFVLKIRMEKANGK